VLQADLKDFKVFEIKFRRIGHLKNTVMVLEPETDDHQLTKLVNAIMTVLLA
jgi:hypothetical protein